MIHVIATIELRPGTREAYLAVTGQTGRTSRTGPIPSAPDTELPLNG